MFVRPIVESIVSVLVEIGAVHVLALSASRQTDEGVILIVMVTEAILSNFQATLFLIVQFPEN